MSVEKLKNMASCSNIIEISEIPTSNNKRKKSVDSLMTTALRIATDLKCRPSSDRRSSRTKLDEDELVFDRAEEISPRRHSAKFLRPAGTAHRLSNLK